MRDHCTTLRSLTIGDDALIERVISSEEASMAESRLDAKTHALVRMGALIAVGASAPSYRPVVDAAIDAGATLDEIVGTLVAVASVTGAPKVVAAAPTVGLAIGYDVGAELETWHPAPGW